MGINLRCPMTTRETWLDAVSRSPLLGPPRIRPGIDLAAVERRLQVTDKLPAADRERLLDSARELADAFTRLGVD